MRLAPDTRQDVSSGAGKKTRKRQLSGQDHADEPEPKTQSKSWILDTVDQVTVGEVYTLCGAADGRLPLIYNWERRTKLEPDVGEHQGNPLFLYGHKTNSPLSLTSRLSRLGRSRLRHRL